MLESIALYNLLIPAQKVTTRFSTGSLLWDIDTEFVETVPTVGDDNSVRINYRAIPRFRSVNNNNGELEYVTYNYDETSPVNTTTSSFNIIDRLLSETDE